ncbi:MAG: c-type cytochrome [Vulcanimicrobiaceae bacterium]
MIGLIAGAGCSSSAKSDAGTATPAAITNGRSIFQTGKAASGVQIVAAQPPLRTNCAACHQPDGSGGLQLPGGVVSADLRYAALVTKQKHPYTPALLERAISTGIDNEGQALSPVMPRWKLSKQDLHDVAAYVLTQFK